MKNNKKNDVLRKTKIIAYDNVYRNILLIKSLSDHVSSIQDPELDNIMMLISRSTEEILTDFRLFTPERNEKG